MIDINSDRLCTNSSTDVAVWVNAKAIWRGQWFGGVKVSYMWEIELTVMTMHLMCLSRIWTSTCLSHSRSHTPPFSPLTPNSPIPTLAFYLRVTLSHFSRTTIFSASFSILVSSTFLISITSARKTTLHPASACRCSVGTEQGNSSCNLPCSHFLSDSYCLWEPIWFPNASSSAVEILQWLENTGLGIASDYL